MPGPVHTRLGYGLNTVDREVQSHQDVRKRSQIVSVGNWLIRHNEFSSLTGLPRFSSSFTWLCQVVQSTVKYFRKFPARNRRARNIFYYGRDRRWRAKLLRQLILIRDTMEILYIRDGATVPSETSRRTR